MQNYRAFDIGGHFMQKLFKWFDEESRIADCRKYTEEEKRHFCDEYARQWNEVTGDSDTGDQVFLESEYGYLLAITFDIHNMLCFMAEQDDKDPLNLLLLEFDADAHLLRRGNLLPLHIAAEVIQLLLEAGADVNLVESDGNNALHLAAYCGTIEIVESLLAHGAAVDVLGPDDRTVLHVAAAGDNPDVVPSLCRAGVAINALDASGNTALHLAALHGRTALTRLLLEMGADVSVSPEDGRTALHYAASVGQADLLQLLVDAGAEVGALHSDEGHTALHYAAVNGSADAFRVLLRAADAQKFDLLSPCCQESVAITTLSQWLNSMKCILS
ncbi:hypothetical protein AO1008_05004 [Aspergillus oryzae 100-8]|uniref:Uncharacterized protein n=1 Tax=Aspergillus oryzae (strain 3.042) TaxID=1160506 RepID=I8TS91_ASPO3|nr:hypothetical protein Ao3042_06584 [Aspergillus oryzae 3.042]KDE78791.1 hypothetical protein AO1008_05004 [Aspergillus oryzae 100-8]|eukprot:EIT77170.1 hypothetical protein Ao3042_06584 [Aspergillus oryzae 3.042]